MDFPTVKREGDAPIKGIGVIYYPPGQTMFNGDIVDNFRLAKQTAMGIKQGSIVCFQAGSGWDFKILGGDPSQVIVEQVDASQ